VECLPQGGRGSGANLTGGLAIATDPDVESAGVDTGYVADAYTLRAPDLAIGNVPDAPGWVQGAPPLAVEYADTGQDEADLAVKIQELFAAGTRLVWVARLMGPRRVEVHRPDAAMVVLGSGDLLKAPGILRNPVPVDALFDRDVAREAALRNLLQRFGYEGLDAVRAEGEVKGEAKGKAEGKAEGELVGLRAAIFKVLESRGLDLEPGARMRISGCTDHALLDLWLGRAAVCKETSALLDPPSGT